MNKFKPMVALFVIVILFGFCLNIELTSQINRINLFQSKIDIRTLNITSTDLDMAPWYNPVLNGHYIIHQPNMRLFA